QKDVGDARAVGNVGDRMAVRRPLGVEIQSTLPRKHGDLPGGDLIQRDLPLGKAQQVEARSDSAIGGECDARSIRGELRLKVGEPVIGQLGKPGSVDVDGVEVGDAAIGAAEYEAAAVRRPTWTDGALDREIEAVLDALSVD